MRILAVGAHLDDIELARGGTIAKAVKAGHQVKMVVLSDSSYTNHAGNFVRTKESAFQEGAEAARILGVADLKVLDFPTKDIPYDSAVVESLNVLVDECKPDIIFTHWPFDTHKSHQNSALSTIAAGRYYNSIIMYEPITPAGRSYVGFRPQFYVDISDFIDQKIGALKAHQTEYEKYGEEWLEGVKARAQYRGFEIGVKFAEAFEVMRYELRL